jgi:hypothetical protein
MRLIERAIRVVAILFLGLLSLAIPDGSSAKVPSKRILILYPFHSYMPGFIKYETGLRFALSASQDYRFELFVEWLLGAPPPGPLAAVVTSRLDIEGTLALALHLHPDVRKVFVVSGASRFDQMAQGWAREPLRGFENRVEIQYLSGLPMDELVNQVAKLPEHSLVFYLSFTQDGNGQAFNSPDALALISKQANAPIYSVAETYIGSGIVGGHLISYSALGAMTARAVLRTLSGEQPGGMESLEGAGNQYVFDARELKRWGSAEENLPPGREVRGAPRIGGAGNSIPHLHS